MRNQAEHKYWVYIMSSLTGTLYVGITGQLGFRVLQHKAGEVEGFSRTYKCVRLIYYEGFDDYVRRFLVRNSSNAGDARRRSR